MKLLPESAVVAALAGKLREEGSWCGETHLQKAAYFLKELLHVPLESEFILYKHGPFSFEFRSTLTRMRAVGFLKLVPESYYGPRLEVTEAGQELMKKFPKTLAKYNKKIDFVASELGGDGVARLEKVTTAHFIQREWPDLSDEQCVEKMIELKPHISPEEAEAAFARVNLIRKKASAKGFLQEILV